jgi:hypothetical protein
VNVLAFGILATPRGGPRLSVFGRCARNGHHHFAVFLLQGFGSVCIDPPFGNRVGIRDPSRSMVLPVKFRTVLNMQRLTVAVGPRRIYLVVVVIGLDHHGETNGPLSLDNLSRRDIPQLINGAWFGWPAFRRGFGTRLNEAKVDDKTIQSILRHADVSTMQAYYIQPNRKPGRAGCRS